MGRRDFTAALQLPCQAPPHRSVVIPCDKSPRIAPFWFKNVKAPAWCAPLFRASRSRHKRCCAPNRPEILVCASGAGRGASCPWPLSTAARPTGWPPCRSAWEVHLNSGLGFPHNWRHRRPGAGRPANRAGTPGRQSPGRRSTPGRTGMHGRAAAGRGIAPGTRRAAMGLALRHGGAAGALVLPQASAQEAGMAAPPDLRCFKGRHGPKQAQEIAAAGRPEPVADRPAGHRPVDAGAAPAGIAAAAQRRGGAGVGHGAESGRPSPRNGADAYCARRISASPARPWWASSRLLRLGLYAHQPLGRG